MDENTVRQLWEAGELSDEAYRQLSPVAATHIEGSRIKSKKIDVSGDFTGRDKITYITNNYLTHHKEQNEEELKDAIGRYLYWVMTQYSRLDLRGMQSKAKEATEISVQDVYISLSASMPRQQKKRRRNISKPEHEPETAEIIDMNQLFPKSPRLAIVGGAGSGKTTWLRLIAATVAHAIYTDNHDETMQWLGLQGELPLPIFITLSDYNQYRKRAAGKTLVDYLSDNLQEKQIVTGLPDNFFEWLLTNNRPCCLLFDGLDEIADTDEREVVSNMIQLLSDNKGIPHLVISSRTRAYDGRAVLQGFRVATVLPMEPEQVDALAGRWCQAVYHELDVKQETADLQAAIREMEAKRKVRNQMPLLTTPLLVTLVAIVHDEEKKLPEQRAELYKKCVDVLLMDKHKSVRLPNQKWGGDENQKRALLAELAYQMMSAGNKAGRKVEKEQIERWLRPICVDEYGEAAADKRLHTFLHAMRERNSLLNERDEQYEFIHLTFQEYLAAYYLAEVERDIQRIANCIMRDGRVNDGWWRETILLTIGYLGLSKTRNALDLIDGLITVHNIEPADQLAAVELATVAFVELRSDNKEMVRKLRGALTQALASKNREITIQLRMMAGDALNMLGDDRKGVLDLQPDWIQLPAGSFQMGDPPYEASIKQPFAMARYPVTNRQYRRFIEAGGYGERAYWTQEEGWRYKEEQGWQEPRYWRDATWNRDNQPVVGVSWWEALAFCNWLTGRLRAERLLNAEQQVALPTEAEWERAARHTDGRAYPWGDWRHDAMANHKQLVNRTTAVGIFPENRSHDGLLDMSGNVREWCQTRWDDENDQKYPLPYTAEDGRENLAGGPNLFRVLRGGSWYDNPDALRCAARSGSLQYDRYDHRGFRVCVRPHFPSHSEP